VWADNSGYGELGRLVAGKFEPLLKLPGWTRGLALCGSLAFVGTSRVITRYRHYAPGLDPERCETGVHVVDLRSAQVLGSLCWPNGNQIFAIEAVAQDLTQGFPFVRPGSYDRKHQAALFSRGVAA
jgi:hypothetical protein